MKAGWKTKQLAELLQRTETVDPSSRPNSPFHYIDVSSVSNQTFQIEETQQLLGKDAPSRARKLVATNDVLFATIRPTLKRIAVVPERLNGQVCSTGYFVLRPTAALCHRFLFYFLLTEQFGNRMSALQKGASYPAVTDGDVRSQEIPVPSLSDQRRIVGILDEAFEGIATARANTQKNLENAREVFDSQREAALAPRTGWNLSLLGDLCEIKHGFAFKGEFFRDSGEFVLLTPGNFFERGGYRDRGDKQKFYVGEIPLGYVLKRGDMLVAMTEQAAGLLGSPLLVPESNKFLHNQRLGLVAPRQGQPWAAEFFFHVFNLARVRREIHEGGTGAKVRHTSPGRIQAIQVAYPGDVEGQRVVAEKLAEVGDGAESLVSIYQQKLAALDELKKSLLHRAFSGQL